MRSEESFLLNQTQMMQLLWYWTIDKMMHEWEERRVAEAINKKSSDVLTSLANNPRPITLFKKHLSSTNQISEQQKSKKKWQIISSNCRTSCQFFVLLLSSLIMSFNFLSVLSYLSLDFSVLIQRAQRRCATCTERKRRWEIAATTTAELSTSLRVCIIFFIFASCCALRRRRRTSPDVLW